MIARLLETFEGLVNMVRQDHKDKNSLVGTGHDFSHALMVAQYCLKIADQPLATLGWIAGICHNTDRLFSEFEPIQITGRVMSYLATTTLTGQEKESIVEAVLRHSAKPSEKDSELTVILMDADKLANIGLSIVVRAAQFQPTLPPINLKYLGEYPPGCDYKNPGSIYRDTESSLEWEEPGWFRTPRAIELAKPMFAELRRFQIVMLQQYRDVGLLPYPFPEDFKV